MAGLTRSDCSERVFALPDGRDMGAALYGVWKRVRKKAELDGMRLHDLRHSYASIAVSTGEGLHTVAGLLGHAELETTMGYAHLAEAPLAAAAGRVSGRLTKALGSPTLDRPRKARKVRKRKPVSPKPPEPVLPPIDKNLSEEERYWELHVRAFRVGSLRLKAFCAEHGLGPERLHQALREHHERVKAERRRVR